MSEHLGLGPDGLEIRQFSDAAVFEAWLLREPTITRGGWLAHAKKSSGADAVRPVTVSHRDALDVCLCLGWIDSQRRSHDERLFLQRYPPRRPTRPWSQVNREKVAVLDAQPAAAEFFATLRGSNRDAVLHRVQAAKRPETRARRIAEFVAMLAEG